MWAALLALIVPWPLIYFTWMKVQIIFLIQLVVFLALFFLAWHPKVRMALVPRSILRANTRRRAAEPGANSSSAWSAMSVIAR